TTAVDDDLTSLQYQADIAGDVFLGLGDESIQRTLQWRVPQAVVDLFGPASIRQTLVACQLALNADIFERFVCTNQGDCTRCLVDLAGRNAWATLFHHGQAADSRCARATVGVFDSFEHADRLAVDSDWLAPVKGDDDVIGSIAQRW